MKIHGLAIVAALAGLCGAQTFDAVSVKQSKPGTPPSFSMEHGRLIANQTVSGYILAAYSLMSSREQMDAMLAHAPKWVTADTFEVHAQADGNPTKDQMLLMLRSLLADRFRLEVHTLTAEVSVLAMTLEKPGATGPKLRPHAEGAPCDAPPPDGVFPPACDVMMAVPKPHGAIMVAQRNATLEQIAALLSSVGRLAGPVVNQTGLSGRFDFTLEYLKPGQQVTDDDTPVATLEEALREQLGLKLKAGKGSVDTLIVDRVERPAE